VVAGQQMLDRILTGVFDFLEHGKLQADFDQPHGNKP